MKADYNNMFLMINNFSGWVEVDVEDPRWGKPDFGRWARQLLRGEAEADPPLRLVYATGGKPGNVMWDTFVVLVVVSERVVELLQAHGFTGWKTYAVEIHNRRKGKPLTGYYGLAVTGRVGRRDATRSQQVERSGYSVGFGVVKAFFFEGDYWDGSDFCCPEVGTEIIVTRRVAEVLQEAGIGWVSRDGRSGTDKKVAVLFLPLPEFRLARDPKGFFAAGSPLLE